MSVSEIAGGSKLFWDIVGGWPSTKGTAIQLPWSTGVIAAKTYLTLEACTGVAQERSFSFSNQADREYYVFTGSTVVRSDAYGWHEVRGAINSKYVQMKGWFSWLGIPKSDEFAAGAGRASTFMGGAVCWSPKAGPRNMTTAVWNRWQALGGSAGPLG